MSVEGNEGKIEAVDRSFSADRAISSVVSSSTVKWVKQSSFIPFYTTH